MKTHRIRDSSTTSAPEAIAIGSKPQNKKKKQKFKGKDKGALQSLSQINKNQKGKGMVPQQYTWRREDNKKDQHRPKLVWEDVCAYCGLEGHWSK